MKIDVSKYRVHEGADVDLEVSAIDLKELCDGKRYIKAYAKRLSMRGGAVFQTPPGHRPDEASADNRRICKQ